MLCGIPALQSLGVVVSGLLACNLSSSVPESRDPFQSTVLSVNWKTFSGVLIYVYLHKWMSFIIYPP